MITGASPTIRSAADSPAQFTTVDAENASYSSQPVF